MNIMKFKKIFVISFLPVLLLTLPLRADQKDNITKINKLYENEKYEQALVFIEKLIKQDPANYEYRYQQGYCLHELGRNEESRQVLTGLLKDDWLPAEYKPKINKLLYDVSESRSDWQDIKKDVDETSYAPPSEQSFLILFEGSVGLLTGKILDIEANSFEVGVLYQDGHVETANPSHIHWQYGLNFKWMLSLYLGIQFGIQKQLYVQKLSVGGGDYEEESWGGDLINCYNPYLGMVFNIISVSDVAWFLGLRMGYLNGDLAPAVSLFDFVGFSPILFKVKGMNAGIGTGVYGVASDVFVYGLAFYAYYNSFKTEEQVYYDLDENFSIMSYDLYLQLGFKI